VGSNSYIIVITSVKGIASTFLSPILFIFPSCCKFSLAPFIGIVHFSSLYFFSPQPSDRSTIYRVFFLDR